MKKNNDNLYRYFVFTSSESTKYVCTLIPIEGVTDILKEYSKHLDGDLDNESLATVKDIYSNEETMNRITICYLYNYSKGSSLMIYQLELCKEEDLSKILRESKKLIQKLKKN